MRRRTYRLATGVLAAVAAVAVWAVATGVFPYHSLNHDEAVYLQQAELLLRGRLALRPPLDDVFRPWFFVDAGERLYPKYAPVPAAVFALGELAGGYRLALAGVGAAIVALTVAVVGEAFDRPTGLVAGAFVLLSPLFLIDSSVFLPYAPTTMLNLLFAYGYLRADRSDDRRYAAVAGAAVGLAFFARPYTAVLFALPFVAHALWTLRRDPREALGRQLTVAGLGLVGVAVALGYNALLTGSPWLFPYEAFAPRDGLGFGRRAILNHEVRYTPRLALRANAEAVRLFASEWIAGGPVGAGLAAVGVAWTLRRRPPPRQAVLAGTAVSVVAGNVYFWGNFNVLGDLDRAGDGLVAVLGPYYHFDLLVPTAAFAAAGALRGGRALYRALDDRLNRRLARTVFAVALVACAGVAGAVTAQDLDRRLGANAAVTDTYEDAYEPFADGPPADSLVFLPTPYGDWLNHPFQPLRNDPDFDGRAVYAVDERPFEVVDEFPGRRAYRYAYQGPWSPRAGAPDAARLQRVRDVSGSGVRLDSTLGVPAGASALTVRLATDEGSAYYVAEAPSESLELDLAVADGRVGVGGDVRSTGNATVEIDGRDTVRVTAFVDYGAGGGFSYRFELPVEADDDGVRALTPRVGYCPTPRVCGGDPGYVPDATPDGVFVRIELRALEPNP